MRVDTGFSLETDCARNSPILVGDDFRCDYARGFARFFYSDYLSSVLLPTHTKNRWDCPLSLTLIGLGIGITRSYASLDTKIRGVSDRVFVPGKFLTSSGFVPRELPSSRYWMGLGGKNHLRQIERVGLCKQQVEILQRFSKKETLHFVRLCLLFHIA